MQNLLRQSFLFIAIVIFIAAGAVFCVLGLHFMTTLQVEEFFRSLTRGIGGLDLMAGTVMVFFGLALIFVSRSVSQFQREKFITIDIKGAALKIRIEAIEEVVDQVLAGDAAVSDFQIHIYRKAKSIYLDVALTFAGDISIPEETERIRDSLTRQVARVFGFSSVQIDFQVMGVSAESPAEPSPGSVASENEDEIEEDSEKEDEDRDENADENEDEIEEVRAPRRSRYTPRTG